MDGTFLSMQADDFAEAAETEHEYMSDLPIRREDRGAVQVMISDYMIQSLVNSSLELKWYDMKYTANGDTFNQYVKGFSNAYGDFSEVEI